MGEKRKVMSPGQVADRLRNSVKGKKSGRAFPHTEEGTSQNAVPVAGNEQRQPSDSEADDEQPAEVCPWAQMGFS